MAWKPKYVKFAEPSSKNHMVQDVSYGNGASAVLLPAKDRGKRTPLRNFFKGRRLTPKPDATYGWAIAERADMDWSNSMADLYTFTVLCGKLPMAPFLKVFSLTISAVRRGVAIPSICGWLRRKKIFSLQDHALLLGNMHCVQAVRSAEANLLHTLDVRAGFAKLAHANEAEMLTSGKKPPKEI